VNSSNSVRVLVNRDALHWLDLQENESKKWILSNFGNNVLIFENEIDIISQYLGYWTTITHGSGLTIKQLVEPQNEQTLLLITTVTLLMEAQESLQAARRLLLCGYTSRMLSCLRTTIEALNYTDICGNNGEEARKWWLSLEKVSKPDAYRLHPIVSKLMKLHDALSERGVHPRGLARLTSAIGKSEPNWLNKEKLKEFHQLKAAGISEFTRLSIIVSWGFLEYMTQKLAIKDVAGYNVKRVQDMLDFLSKEFGQFGIAIDKYTQNIKMAAKNKKYLFGIPQ